MRGRSRRSTYAKNQPDINLNSFLNSQLADYFKVNAKSQLQIYLGKLPGCLQYTYAARITSTTVLEFLNNLWGLGTEQEQGCRTGPLGWYWSLGIDSWTP